MLLVASTFQPFCYELSSNRFGDRVVRYVCFFGQGSLIVNLSRRILPQVPPVASNSTTPAAALDWICEAWDGYGIL